ncbi:MAG: hypothetical protein LBK76_03570 [Verrucomicrobiales bacterium]|jgi:hypothetical protein|nr:hypothetical protein [Verrucomicrobiales bacterium]
MQIPVVKINALGWLAWSLLTVTAPAQTQPAPKPAANQPPPSAAPAPAPAAAPAPAPTPAAAPAPSAPAQNVQQSSQQDVNSAVSTSFDYLFNRTPGQGTAAKELFTANKAAQDKAIAQDVLGIGFTMNADQRLRFEKYLAMTEVPPERLLAYTDEGDKVLAMLRDRQPFDAWKELFVMADYREVDGGLSWELANRVESIWNADRTNVTLGRDNTQLRREIDRANRTADMMADDLRRADIDYQRQLRNVKNSNANNAKPTTSGTAPSWANDGTPFNVTPASISGIQGKMQITEEYMASLQAKAKIMKNELKGQKLWDHAQRDFGLYIATLFKSGRYRHVLIAADFYRRIFDEGDYPVAIAEQVNRSLEVAQSVNVAVDVFNNKLADDEIASATYQLQKAFISSEFHPALLGLERAKKKKVEAFNRAIGKMQNLIEARDFGGLEKQLDEMRKIAPDFDETKGLALVNAVKLRCQLSLGKARLAVQQGDLPGALVEFQVAAETWPGNPDLKDKALSFFDSQDLKTQALTELDRLVTEGNYRGIFERQLAFAPAIKDDQQRQEQLKAALEKVRDAEMAIEKANVMRARGDVHGAWETIELAVKHFPTDVKLNTLRGELSGEAAEFVSAINKAKNAEAREDWGYSLTWFAIAQRHYPASQVANDEIARIAKKILEKSAL